MGHPRMLEVLRMMPLLGLVMVKLLLWLMGPNMMLLVKRSEPRGGAVLLYILYMGNIYIALFPRMGVVVDIRIWPLVAGSISRHAWILPNRAALASPGQSNDVLDHCCSVLGFQKACGCWRLFVFRCGAESVSKAGYRMR